MISSSYLMLIVVTLIIGMGAQWYVNHKLKTYSHVANSTGLTGAEAARQMLSYYGISNVQVFRGGPGQDYFDPRSNSVTLDPDAYPTTTLTAVETAVREMGEIIKKTAALTADTDGLGCAKLVVFCNAVEDNPFMAGAFCGVGEPECAINGGVSGPGVVKRALESGKG